MKKSVKKKRSATQSQAIQSKTVIPVSTSGHIGGHEIVAEFKRIEADPAEYGSDKGFGILPASWKDKTEAIEALKKVARRNKANGIIHLTYSTYAGELGVISGIAVKIRKHKNESIRQSKKTNSRSRK